MWEGGGGCEGNLDAWVCWQRGSPPITVLAVVQVVAAVGWMPRGQGGCDSPGATLPCLGWEGLVPWLVGMALAEASPSASQCDLPPDLGSPLAAVALSPGSAAPWRHVLGELNPSPQGEVGGSGCPLLMSEQWVCWNQM